MIVYLNGRYLPEEEALVSIHDRGFLYGDGLFETMRVYESDPFLWKEHMDRFQRGCDMARIVCPLSRGELAEIASETLTRNRLRDAILRLTISRGVGPRGYSPRQAGPPTLCMAAYQPPMNLPETYRVIVSSIRLPSVDPLASFKHSNKLRQVLARAEADEAGVNEALLLNSEGQVIEGTTTNLFWIERSSGSKTLCTPPSDGILAGVTRDHILRNSKMLKIPTMEKHISVQELTAAEGVFLTSSGIEVMEVAEINGVAVKRSPLVARIKANYRQIQ